MSDTETFFKTVIPDQIHLTAIHPDGASPITSQDFGANADEAAAWAVQQNSAGWNVHYTTNLVSPLLNKKPTKTDICGCRYVHVDIDPPKDKLWSDAEREEVFQRVISGPIAPSFVIWSGNGWQVLYRLSDTAIDQHILEQANRGLIAYFGGDVGTHNIDRLLRVPGLINYPGEEKRKRGRTEQLSRLVVNEPEMSFRIEDLLRAFPAPVQKPRATHEIKFREVELLTADDLNLPPDASIWKTIDEPAGIDRSADTFKFACEGFRHGLDDHQIMGILLNPENAISSHCLDQKDPRRAAQRAIEAALAEDDVKALAKAHQRERERALAAGELDRPTDATKIWTPEAMLRDCVFIEEGAQVADTTRPGWVLQRSEFLVSTSASTMLVSVSGKNGSSRNVRKKIADVWLEHPDRRTVTTMTFRAGAPQVTQAPSGKTALNTWRGFLFGRAPIDWPERAAAFVDHVRWLFGDDAGLFLDWLAHIAQKPGELPSIAWLHIAKRTGMGRNWIATILGRVFRGYAALAVNLSQILRTNYNGTLGAKVLAVVDEVDEGSCNHKYQTQQELKQLVTEETRLINPKYGRQYIEFNSCRWLIFSNSTTALPLEDDDRRFCVVQCHESPKDAAYYSSLYRLREDPLFIASVAEFLTQRDISHFNPGQRAPMTKAKEALLERTRSTDESTLRGIVERWPVDVINNVELDELLGVDGSKGSARRYALERAGIVKVGNNWKASTNSGFRKTHTAYAVRNVDDWSKADQSALRKEIARMNFKLKETIFYSDAHDLI